MEIIGQLYALQSPPPEKGPGYLLNMRDGHYNRSGTVRNYKNLLTLQGTEL